MGEINGETVMRRCIISS